MLLAVANLPLASAEDGGGVSAAPEPATVRADSGAAPSDPVPPDGSAPESAAPPADGAAEGLPGPVDDPTEVPPVAPGTEPTASPTPIASEPAASEPQLDGEPDPDTAADGAVTPLVVGEPDGDGVTTPYAYWVVEDTEGNPVGGVTFAFQRRNAFNTAWLTPALTVTDCTAVPCTGVDRDSDPGEYLVKWVGSDTPGAPPTGETIAAGSRNRVRPLTSTPPSGYGWVSSPTTWVDSNTVGWDGSGTDRTLDFGVFAVQSLRPVCTAGSAYAVSGAGQLQQLWTAGGAVTSVGTPAPGVSNFNGLGVGPGGQLVYAFERTTNSGAENATVWTYNVTTGVWTSTGYSTSSLGGNTGTYLVGGAVNPTNSLYYFGGYTSSGTTAFKLYRYNPAATPRITFAGTITTATGTGNNGDLAFDAAGNLYLTRGVGTAQTVFTVSAADVIAATGGTIVPSASRSFTTTLSDVNGVALDGSGRALLGVSAAVNSYDLPDWSNRATITLSGLNSTDLASCSFPPTVTVEKYVEGARVTGTDQFTLSLQRGGTSLATVTTDGPATGLQARALGPLPAVRGVALTFTEAAAGTTNLGQYLSRYVCRTDGVVTQQGSGTSGTLTLAATGQAHVCTFYNVRRFAALTVHKDVTDANGQNPTARQGWTVGAAVSATSGTVTAAPTSASQQTNAAGNATWSLSFGSATDRATATVSEQLQDGYQFLTGQCLITRADGTTATTTLTGAAAQPVAGIAPGDSVVCTYVNRPVLGTIFWQKLSNDSPAVTIGPSSWTVQGPGGGGPTLAVPDCIGAVAADCASQPDKDERVGQLRVTGLAWGDYVVSEAAPPVGFERPTPFSWPVTVTAQNAQAGATFGPVVNTRILGTATWTKVDNRTPATLLAGSEWQLTGPTGPGASAPSAAVAVVDCVATSPAECSGVDTDPAAGRFRLPGLAWGDYSLAETKAPPGYVVDPNPRSFTVESTNVAGEIALGALANQPMAPPVLPLTGGLARDFYTVMGVGVMGLAAVGFGVSRRRTRSTG